MLYRTYFDTTCVLLSRYVLICGLVFTTSHDSITDVSVMVLANLWQPAGICNGGPGIVREVVFERDSEKDSLPLFVVVDIPAYTGPPFPKWSSDPKKSKWVPIPVKAASMTTDKGTESRSVRHQIPIALTRALTHHKAQGMSLDKIYVKLYNTSARGKQRLHNNFGILYTALSRCTDPRTNVLIERFAPELLDAIAQSDTMKAMRKEFDELDHKCKRTLVWARELLAKFDDLFEESQHCRESKVVLTQQPVAPEKVINMMTKRSKTNSRFTSTEASTNDYHDSRGIHRPLPKPTSTTSRKKRKRATGRRRKRVAPPSTRSQRARRKKHRVVEDTTNVVRQTIRDLCEDAGFEYTAALLKKEAASRC